MAKESPGGIGALPILTPSLSDGLLDEGIDVQPDYYQATNSPPVAAM
jgi:hypothetical protein